MKNATPSYTLLSNECKDTIRKPNGKCSSNATSFADDVVKDVEQTVSLEPFYNQFKIDLEENLAPPPVAMNIYDESGNRTILFSKYNFSIGTGKAKSKKTFLASMFMAAALAGRYGNFEGVTKGVNVWFCTEQARYKVQQIGKRIVKLSTLSFKF